MKSAWVGIAAVFSIFAGLSNAAEAWSTDYNAAKVRSDETGKVILMNFTGSDWCPPCIRLEREVFATEAFKQFAEASLILFIADFPRRTEQTEALKTQNRELAENFGVTAFPTILLVDSEGNVLGRTGFRPGGPDAYIQHLKQLMTPADE